MTPAQGLWLGLASAGPVTVWMAGHLLDAGPGVAATVMAQGVHGLWLLQGLSLLVGVPLLAAGAAPGRQLAAVSLTTTLAWPLLTLAVLADGVSWAAAVTAGAMALLVSWLLVTGASLGLRVLPAGPRRQLARFAAAAAGGLAGWATQAHWLGRLAGP